MSVGSAVPEDHRKLLTAFRSLVGSYSWSSQVAPFLGPVSSSMPPRNTAPRPLAVLRHLDRVAEIAIADAAALVSLLREHAPGLPWGQTYDRTDFGAGFLEDYGWLEILGTRGLFASETVAGGLLMLGPNTDYPDHRHEAEEVYVPLTPGTLWSIDGGPYTEHPAGTVIHHPTNTVHAMRTRMQPLLAFYLWRGGDLAQKSEITGGAGA